jgi:hypothetical protein
MSESETDLIEEAIEENTLERERTAIGEVADTEIELRKESYRTRTQETFWKVAVYLDGAMVPKVKRTELDREAAEKEFERLVEKYDLTEE